MVRDVDLDRPRFVFGEHTEHESSVQLTELFDGDLVTYGFKLRNKIMIKKKCYNFEKRFRATLTAGGDGGRLDLGKIRFWERSFELAVRL